jgi:Bacterial Ig-like domain (group 3)/FG-GAP-like repeat
MPELSVTYRKSNAGISAQHRIMAALSAWVLLASIPVAAAQTPTTTTLASSAQGTIATGTVLTLAATVRAGNAIVAPGQVIFCNADVASCSGIAIIGAAQLNTKVGTATLRFVPASGSHNYKAVFIGTNANATSSSNVVAVTATGPPTQTTTTLTSSGSPADYTLTATVTEMGQFVPLTGLIPFTDTTDNNKVLGTAPLGSSATTPNFVDASGSPVTAGSGTNFVAVGDFNGDGFSDLVTANYFANSVSVFLGDGTGRFTQTAQSPITVGGGSGPFNVGIGDFTGNGIEDLVATDFDISTLTVLQGDGTGGFTVFGSPLSAPSPSAIAVADFNRDGNLDIAVTSFTKNTVTVYLGDGTRHFTQSATSPIPIGSGPYDIAVGDINGDGIPDLVTANRSGNDISILLGDGSGGFSVSSVPVGIDPRSVVIEDFNGDGIADIAVANNDSVSGVSNISILLGDGSGGFSSSTVGFGLTSIYIASADFNGDGIPDLATANGTSDSASVLLGDGHGGFTVAATMSSPGDPSHVSVGEFHGNGIVDLAVSNFSVNNVGIFLDQPQQTATAILSGLVIPGTGTQTVTSSYPGDTNYSASLSGTVNLTAIKLTTSLSVTPSPAASSYGKQVALTATLVVPPNPLAPSTDNELVTFFNGTTVLGSSTLLSGAATLSTSTLPTGLLSLSAQYAGDSSLLPSTSPPIAYTVGKAAPVISWPVPQPIGYGVALSTAQLNAISSVPGTFVYTPSAGTVLSAGNQTLTTSFAPTDTVNYTSTTATVLLTINKAVPLVNLAASNNSVVIGSPVTLTAQVVPPVSGNATGSITFLDGTVVLGSSAVVGNAAVLTLTNLASGSNSITAVYGGDSNFTAISSAAVTVTVADFAVTITSPPSSPLPPGAVASFIVDIKSVNASFNSAVSLSATNLPPGASYVFSPSSVVPGPNGASSTLTVNIPNQSSAVHNGGSGLPILALLFVPLALLKPPGSRYRRLMLSVLLSIASIATLTGCGSGGYFNQAEEAYNITVIGTSGSLSRSATTTLTVQ